jgi:hypothetical protein
MHNATMAAGKLEIAGLKAAANADRQQADILKTAATRRLRVLDSTS